MNEKLSRIRQTIAEKLRYYRTQKGYTTIEVGEMVGRSDRTVSGWENGRGQPDAEMFLTLCKIYDVENVEVFFGKDIKYAELSEMENRHIALFRELNDEGQEIVYRTVEGLVSTGKYKKDYQPEPLEAGA